MSYCINPNCSHRENPDNLESCQSCNTKLLINNRYQILNHLRVGQAYNSELFEVKDLERRGTLKVLKTLAPRHNNSDFAKLFAREAIALKWLTERHPHPGIPKVEAEGYFEFAIGNGFRTLRCLVMERIEGQNLEDWLNQNQPISQEQALNWLQELANILDKVHGQKLWHRDIKPANIMLKPDGQLVLIDFGSVGSGRTQIYSAAYTPPEQMRGDTVSQSDFFALGRTFIYLLTGKQPFDLPTDSQGRLCWRDQAKQVSRNLADLIDNLMAPSPRDRPRDTQVLLQCIETIKVPFWKRLPKLLRGKFAIKSLPIKWLTGSTILLGGGVLIWHYTRPQFVDSVGNNLSFGEEILVPGTLVAEKQAGVEAFRRGNYAQAVKWLQKARQEQLNDPETLIYLNNARTVLTHTNYYTIAAIASLGNPTLDTTQETLRGVAQAQDEFNATIKPGQPGLKVLIANDNNSPNQAKDIAESLASKGDVLAVIGHYTSDATIAAMEVYKKHQLSLISPTSSSDKLTNISPFFFRTIPSDEVNGQALASYLLKTVKQQKAAIFYNPKSTYSISLENQFREKFSLGGGQVVAGFDLSNCLLDPKAAINKAEKLGAKSFVLIPDANVDPCAFRNALKALRYNQGSYWTVGGDTLYTPALLQERELANNLVIGIPWHSLKSLNPEFALATAKLWKGRQVSWRTALAYDATRVLMVALQKRSPMNLIESFRASVDPSIRRLHLQQRLKEPNFQVTGATGVISFAPTGDRNEPIGTLVKVVPSKCSPYGYKFVPLNYSTDPECVLN